jgi:hypothetical protein
VSASFKTTDLINFCVWNFLIQKRTLVDDRINMLSNRAFAVQDDSRIGHWIHTLEDFAIEITFKNASLLQFHENSNLTYLSSFQVSVAEIVTWPRIKPWQRSLYTWTWIFFALAHFSYIRNENENIVYTSPSSLHMWTA